MWVGVSCNLILVSCIGKRRHTHIAYRIIALNNSAVLTVVCIRVCWLSRCRISYSRYCAARCRYGNLTRDKTTLAC